MTGEEASSPPSPISRHARSLRAAVLTGAALVILVIVCYLLGNAWFFALASVCVMFGLFELLESLRRSGYLVSIPIGLAGGYSMMLLAYSGFPGWWGASLGGTAFLALAYALRPNRGPRGVTDAAWTLLAVAWVGGGGAAATWMLRLGNDVEGVRGLIALVLTTSMFDIAAYFTGTYLGKHKMAPHISPSKSWEGVAGGAAGAIAGGLLFFTLFAGFSGMQGVVCGLIVAASAPIGDLIGSLIKRELGTKDFGRVLPGHGGMLDRLDAILTSVVFVAIFLVFVNP